MWLAFGRAPNPTHHSSTPNRVFEIAMKKILLLGLLVVAGSLSLRGITSGHGGTYRGPGDTVPPGGGGGGGGGAGPSTPGPSGPSTGGPSGPSTPGAGTPGVATRGPGATAPPPAPRR